MQPKQAKTPEKPKTRRAPTHTYPEVEKSLQKLKKLQKKLKSSPYEQKYLLYRNNSVLSDRSRKRSVSKNSQILLKKENLVKFPHFEKNGRKSPNLKENNKKTDEFDRSRVNRIFQTRSKELPWKNNNQNSGRKYKRLLPKSARDRSEYIYSLNGNFRFSGSKGSKKRRMMGDEREKKGGQNQPNYNFSKKINVFDKSESNWSRSDSDEYIPMKGEKWDSGRNGESVFSRIRLSRKKIRVPGAEERKSR